MPDRVECTLSFIWLMERRMDFSVPLASSLISSSSRIHRRISVLSMVRGSNCWKNGSRQSSSSSLLSCRPYAFARPAASRSLQMRRSSPLPSAAPISRRFRESFNGFQPLKASRPFFTIRVNAAAVSCCDALIFASSVIGQSFLQRSLPLKEEAWSVSSSMILWYSNLLNVFLFIFIT